MPPPINPDFPIGAVRTVDELMDLATGMEHDAAVRYEQLAAAMERRDEPGLARLFGNLAALEREHEEGIARWAERGGLRRPQPVRFAWRFPETFGDEAEGAAAHVLSPYQALAVAVRNEERAFAFYAYVAAQASDPEVRSRAESLAREELAHVALLRDWRRRAYRAGYDPAARRPRTPRTVDALRALARGLELASAEVDDVAADAVAADGGGEAAGILRRIAAEARRRAADHRPEAADPVPGSAVVEGARASGLLTGGSLTASGALRLSLRNAEEVLESYLDAAERADDPEVLVQAQRLAEEAVGRLALIRTLLPDQSDEETA